MSPSVELLQTEGSNPSGFQLPFPAQLLVVPAAGAKGQLQPSSHQLRSTRTGFAFLGKSISETSQREQKVMLVVNKNLIKMESDIANEVVFYWLIPTLV